LKPARGGSEQLARLLFDSFLRKQERMNNNNH